MFAFLAVFDERFKTALPVAPGIADDAYHR
jgi:hypothetical protein